MFVFLNNINVAQAECIIQANCPKGMGCIQYRCTPKARWCDIYGRCPDGYKNYWGQCLKVSDNGCKSHSDCPSNSGCNTRDGICYMTPCLTLNECKLTLNPLNSPKPYPNCYRPILVGLGFCYK